MGWAVGFDDNWNRDIGYGVPCKCDHPDCKASIDRGLAHRCGNLHSDDGCGLHFCGKHLYFADNKDGQVCERCSRDKDPFNPKPDVPRWMRHKLKDKTWKPWRDKNPKEVARMQAALTKQKQTA